ncbi:MAG: iron-containing alcohol dehydrogenase [Desulfovibrionaceae bacterium]|jgi:alcohol dehydrogenase|nr:iron-containing alcohol dehydrogenase [Desulfovibrionaceae bacterium]
MNLLNGFSFILPTRIEFGVGVVRRLAEFVDGLGARRVLVVTDPGVRAAHLTDQITEPLETAGVPFAVFDGVHANPRDTDVRDAADAALECGADCLVAVGGGSAIDCAKAAAVLAVGGGAARDYEDRARIAALEHAPLPLIAAPTTAGSASEITFSAVITDTAERFKFTVKSPSIAPAVALADPALTVSMPPALTAATGMDALTHAIEGYTALAAEPLADACALHAITLITEHLRTAVNDGGNLEARAGMLVGSILGGLSFSHSDVASVHCLAEAMGGLYDAPHGACNAVILPEVMAYNLSHCAPEYARVARAMGLDAPLADEKAAARAAVEAVRRLAREVGLPSLRSLGARREDFATLATASVINGSNADNPRPMAEADYLAVLESLWAA